MQRVPLLQLYVREPPGAAGLQKGKVRQEGVLQGQAVV
jgi:hypothetical protein